MYPPAHAATQQETRIYNAIKVNNWTTINTWRNQAYALDQTPPAGASPGWLSPARQFDVDYGYAWAHYQDDHEAPEGERVAATAVQVQAENAE